MTPVTEGRRHRMRRRSDVELHQTSIRHLDRNFRTMLAVVLLLLVSGVAQLFYQHHQNSLRTTADLRQCERLQGQRADDNADAWYQQQADLKIAAIIVQPGILRLLAPSARAARVTSAAQYRAIAARLLYEPPTDCKQAVGDPGHYKRPTSIPFPPRYRPAGAPSLP